MRRIMGVDPGLSTTGYGIIETVEDSTTVVTWGAIKPPVKEAIHVRLSVLYDGVLDVIDRYAPTEFAIEEAFYRNNAKTLPCAEYSPRKIKLSVVGNGNASKEQVQYMIGSILKMEKTPDRLDVTDAFATALCHLHQMETVSA